MNRSGVVLVWIRMVGWSRDSVQNVVELGLVGQDGVLSSKGPRGGALGRERPIIEQFIEPSEKVRRNVLKGTNLLDGLQDGHALDAHPQERFLELEGVLDPFPGLVVEVLQGVVHNGETRVNTWKVKLSQAAHQLVWVLGLG